MANLWFDAQTHNSTARDTVVRVQYANGVEQVGYIQDFDFNPVRFNPILKYCIDPSAEGLVKEVKESIPPSIKTPPPLTTFVDYFAACARRYMSTQDATWLQRINSLANGLEDLLK